MGKDVAEMTAEAIENAFEFPTGIFGFPGIHRYLVTEIPGGGDLFKQLVALDDEVAFTLVYPFAFFAEYAPDITAEDLAEVGADSTEQIMLMVIANVPKAFKEATVNLRAPLIFNPFTRKARQIILADERYTPRERLFQ